MGSVPNTTGYELERRGSSHKFIFEFRCRQEGHAPLDNTSKLGTDIMYPFQYIFQFFLTYPPFFLNYNILLQTSTRIYTLGSELVRNLNLSNPNTK
jgi:hypothetical protein